MAAVRYPRKPLHAAPRCMMGILGQPPMAAAEEPLQMCVHVGPEVCSAHSLGLWRRPQA
jgi:hypothetical protein